MRIRTVLAFGSGLALGAGSSYLLDPEHGRRRRQDATARARRRAVAEARVRAAELRERGLALVTEARQGFEATRDVG